MPNGADPDGEDPLGINKLSVDYDYLLYRINDYVASIQLQTVEVCEQQHKLIAEEIINGVVDANIDRFKKLLHDIDALENHFDMLDQLAAITQGFKERLDRVEQQLKERK